MNDLKSADFEAEVLEAQTPTVVDFYADWCGPCKIVAPIIEQLSKEYDGKVKFVKLNTDNSPDIAMKYGIMSIPTIMVFKGGQVMGMVIGAVAASVFKKKIDVVI